MDTSTEVEELLLSDPEGMRIKLDCCFNIDLSYVQFLFERDVFVYC